MSPEPTNFVRPGRIAALAVLLLLALPSRPAAHEIPTDVTIHAFVKPEGQRLRFLVRAPLEAMRDIQFPLRGPGYLDIEAARDELRDAARVWIAQYTNLYENDRRLEEWSIVDTRVSRPSDRSFETYQQALEHMRSEPLPANVELPWQQAMLDVLIEYPIQSATSKFSMESSLARLGLRTTTVLRFLPPDGEVRAYQFHGDPGRVPLDPSWLQAALRFTGSGVHHILIGIDHLLFLLCLVIPFRNFRGLVPVVTSFTVAHSITLIASAFGMAPQALWFPPFIETLIALSIVYMAFENIVGANLRRRWIITFGFGLVHGFGFSFVLSEQLQFAGSHLVTSLLAFNVGVEIGQILVLMAVIPILHLLFRHVVTERMGTILLSGLVAHEAWHWTTERGSAFLQYDIRLPALNAAFLAQTLRWLMLALIAAGLVWAMYELFGRWEADKAEEKAPVMEN